jgi:drug/metabolite transporter (DMT)-like permease
MATERDLVLATRDAAQPGPSTAGLVGGIVSDLQELVRKEIALARQETLEEIGKLKTAGVALAAAGVTLAVGGVLLLLFLAEGLADLVNWPNWAGYVVVGGVLAVVGFVLLSLAQKRFKQIHPVPEKTVETVKENVEWLKQKALGS